MPKKPLMIGYTVSMQRRKDIHDHTLESSKLFPYFAWILILLFCLFVYSITMNLRAAAANLQIQSDISESNLKHPSPLKKETAP